MRQQRVARTAQEATVERNDDSLHNDPLYQELVDRKRGFKREAEKHKILHRGLWALSALLSILVALGTNFSIPVGPVASADLSAGLAIVLPALTAYTVLRSPEQLWILEIQTRNRLSDLQTRMELAFHEDPGFDRTPIREAYFEVMAGANEEWATLKKSS
jgi:hypothetical protein